MTRKLYSRSLLVLALAAFAAPCLAQTGTISGTITDVETGQPVPAAQIQVVSGPAPDAGVLASESGAFRLAVPAGTYSLLVQSVGYRTQRLDGITVDAGETETLDVALESEVLALNAVVVTASRKEEKKTDAPATVAVVSGQEVRETPGTSVASHLYETPGTDIMQTGVQSTNVVVRGFNNVFSGALHALTDNRIAGVPSLRVNLLHFIPSMDDDIERMEVVLGPGSALYGPNTQNGVLHIITRSPLTSQGTVVSVAGGEQDVFKGMFRTAHLLSDDFGVKLSAQFLRGVEWPYADSAEVRARRQVQQSPQFVRASLAAQGVPQAQIDAVMARIGVRDYDFRRWAGEVRADWRVNDAATAVFQAGLTNATGLELTGIGAGQTQDWRYLYYQARLDWNRLFAQLYLNQNDAGESFLVRRGINLTDKSSMLVGQVQHGISLDGEMADGSSRQDFTYGLDYFLTTPKTEGRINGKYEDVDEIKDVGGYLQSETSVTEKLALVLAARVDKSSVLEHAVFSPRAALVFKPTENQAFRLTYNRAFATPTTLNMFLDINGGLAPSLEALSFFSRAQGTGQEGISLGSGANLSVRSPFTPQALGGPGGLLATDHPALRSIMWQAAIGVLVAQGALTPQQAQGILANTNPQNVRLMGLDIVRGTSSLALLSDFAIPDVPPLKESITQTYEVGYQGVLGGRFSLAADAWQTTRDNFTSPLVPVTPLVLLNGQDIAAMLTPLAQAGALTPAQVGAIAQGVAGIPLAVVSSTDIVTNTADVVATYRNFGEVDYWGWDLALKAFLSNLWTLSVSSSWVSTDFFALVRRCPKLLDVSCEPEEMIHVEVEDRNDLPPNSEVLSLNAPDFKATVALGYRDQASGISGEARIRHTSEFPLNSADYIGLACIDDPRFDPVVNLLIRDCVESATLFDLLLGYRIAGTGAEVQLNVQNLARFRFPSFFRSLKGLFDVDHASFVGVPSVGRFAMLQLKYTF